jgi:hypothetical protein
MISEFSRPYKSPQGISSAPAAVILGNKIVASPVYTYERSKPTKQRRQAAQFKGETTMQETLISNSISNSSKRIRRFSSKAALALALAITAMGVAAAPGAQGAGNSSKNTDSPANMVSHVGLSGGKVSRMLLVKRNGKEYLLLGLDSSAQVAMVDVSDPRRPRSIESNTPVSGKVGAEVNVVADTLSVFGKSDAATPASADPKELRNISGVTAFLIDNAHGLIYAANGDGLWIVKTKRQAAEDARPDYYGG